MGCFVELFLIITSPRFPLPDNTVRAPSERPWAAYWAVQGRYWPCNIAYTVPRTVNGTGHTGPSEFCATAFYWFCAARPCSSPLAGFTGVVLAS